MSFFDCNLCPLGNKGTQAVFGEGPAPADVMIIGMNPGYHEARAGHPFIGRAGQLLDEILKEVGLRRRDIYITNKVKHRTPDNRVPTAEETAACAGYLSKELDMVKPKVVILMGAYAFEDYFGQLTVAKANNLWRFTDGRAWVATYHPAGALRNQQYIPEILKVFKSVKEYLDAQAVSVQAV